MNNVSGVGGAPAPSCDVLVGTAGLSPDALLAYCQMQLGALDTQIGNDMQQQQTQLQERTAVQQAQSALQQFGTTGPQTGADFQKCLDAIDQAAAGLPAGDPVAAQLQQFKQSIITQYGYKDQVPGQVDPGTSVYVMRTSNGGAGVSIGRPTNVLEPGGNAVVTATLVPPPTQVSLTGVLTNPPQNGQWQGTTDALGNIADAIKSNSEIQMLSLQDLVSQRQQAVSLASGMMTSEDQTLQNEAKAIGQ